MPTLSDLIADANRTLFAKGLRTLLTMAGVVLGLGALVAISGVTGSMSENVVRSFDRYAATQVLLSAPGDAAPDLNQAGLDRLRALDGVEGVAQLCHHGLVGARNPLNQVSTSLDLVGVSPGGIEVLEPTIGDGHGFPAGGVLDGQPVALLGIGGARTLGTSSALGGSAIEADGRNLSLLGVLEDIPRFPSALNQILLPQASLQRIWGDRCESVDVLIRTKPNWASSVGQVARQIIAPHNQRDWTLGVPPSPDSLRHGVISDLTLLYGVMGAISLAVGVLSIGNTMSVSVLERRAEIGLRRAIGYSAAAIFTLFSLEALTIGFLGGLLGASLGCLVTMAVASISHWPLVITPAIVLVCPLLGAAIGFLGGIIPAAHACRVSAATALRS